MSENVKLTLSTRSDWAQWVPHQPGSAETTRRLIELGAAEFLRFRGVRTVEVRAEGESGSRMMVWRGTEEVSIPHEITDNPGYVNSGSRTGIHR